MGVISGCWSNVVGLDPQYATWYFWKSRCNWIRCLPSDRCQVFSSGQYLGALFGIIFLISKGPRRVGTPPWPVITVLILFVVAYGIDGLNSYLHLSPMLEMAPSLPRLYEPNNVTRLLTGSGMGFSIAVAVFLTFNRTIWSRNDRRPVIGDLYLYCWSSTF
jgi:hypothetical protein